MVVKKVYSFIFRRVKMAGYGRHLPRCKSDWKS